MLRTDERTIASSSTRRMVSPPTRAVEPVGASRRSRSEGSDGRKTWKLVPRPTSDRSGRSRRPRPEGWFHPQREPWNQSARAGDRDRREVTGEKRGSWSPGRPQIGADDRVVLDQKDGFTPNASRGTSRREPAIAIGGK